MRKGFAIKLFDLMPGDNENTVKPTEQYAGSNYDIIYDTIEEAETKLESIFKNQDVWYPYAEIVTVYSNL